MAKMSRFSAATLLSMMGSIVVSASAFAADQPPIMKGKWIGKTYTIVAGSGGHWPTNKGTFDKPGLMEKDLVIEVTGQEDRRFGACKPFPATGRAPKSR
jgi:hypothetical protein